ncbi:hypothetical protein ABVT39_026014 [Epinephelus coioides]
MKRFDDKISDSEGQQGETVKDWQVDKPRRNLKQTENKTNREEQREAVHNMETITGRDTGRRERRGADSQWSIDTAAERHRTDGGEKKKRTANLADSNTTLRTFTAEHQL